MLLIKNGLILDPYTKKEEKADILISNDGKILNIEQNIDENCEIFDAKGLCVSPALIDTHVHFRVPGGEHKETIETGSKAALRGGFATVVCMANTNPLIDSEEALLNILELNKTAPINILQCATITKGFDGSNLVDTDKLYSLGAVGFTDDGVNIENGETTLHAFAECERLSVPISLHEEDVSMVYQPGTNGGSTFANESGFKGALRESENAAVARDIGIAMTSNAKINFQHLSTKESVSLIEFGKKHNKNIFAEVTPHHIMLTEDAVLKHATFAKMNPPLRKEEDRRALISGLKNGIIDIIATDHAPHAFDEKNQPFLTAPSGIIGLETAFSVSITALRDDLSTMEILEKMTVNPAKLYNLQGKSIEIGNKCEIFIYNPSETMKYNDFSSKSFNTPFKGRELFGKIYATIIGDKILYKG